MNKSEEEELYEVKAFKNSDGSYDVSCMSEDSAFRLGYSSAIFDLENSLPYYEYRTIESIIKILEKKYKELRFY